MLGNNPIATNLGQSHKVQIAGKICGQKFSLVLLFKNDANRWKSNQILTKIEAQMPHMIRIHLYQQILVLHVI